MQSKGVVYYKGLNGIRAIAALGVLFSHIGLALKELTGENKFWLYDVGGYGVTIFFALSGFLITSLLIIEKEQTGTISIKQFYVRRILRIWPIYYLYILLVVICGYLFLNAYYFEPKFLYYLFFAANVPYFGHFDTLRGLGHLWSIGVEEQFYLFWPWLFVFSKNIKKTIVVTVSFLVFIRVVAYLILKIGPSGSFNFYAVLHTTRFDCMGIGALGALILHYKKERLLKLLTSTFMQWTTIFVFIAIIFGKFRFSLLLEQLAAAVIGLSLILSNVTLAKPLLDLENRFCNYIGRISYGIYVYHILIILLCRKLLEKLGVPLVPSCILLVVCVPIITIFIANLSYKYFEAPFLKLKRHFTKVNTTNNAVLATPSSTIISQSRAT